MTEVAKTPDSGLFAYASANLPRYTSYPTAPHCMPLNEAQLCGWFAATMQFEIIGGRTRIRTLDPLIKSQLLYQLSYAPDAEKLIGFAVMLHTARRGFVQPLGGLCRQADPAK